MGKLIKLLFNILFLPLVLFVYVIFRLVKMASKR